MTKPLDDLLRETLRARATDQAAACLDAERAAAFIEGTMSARAFDEAEVHLADCPRCQALLGALVRTTPPALEPAWWRRPAMAWLAPLTAAAAALAIWINVSDNAGVEPVQSVRKDVAPASLPVAPAPVTTPPQSPSLRDADDASAGASGEKRVGETAAPSASARTFRSEAAAPANPLDARQIPPPSPVPEPGPAPPVPSPAGPAAPPPRAADAAPSAARLAGSAVADNSAVVTRTLTTIVSSNGTSQWRIGTGGELQHSADGGVMWRTQTTGITEAPAAGSSPSPSVCWLVGREGLVLMTTDEGQSWRRVPFPVAADLVSVRATDDRNATVVASDGRTFVTANGGRSWQP
jgi:hypothetical protein